VGNVSSITGPIPGIFQGAPYGVEAYFAYVNAHGGVDGRQLKLRSQDDGFTCGLNSSATQASVNSVFAYVGDFSIYDNCGAKVLAAHPGVPRLAEEDSSASKALPAAFAAQPLPLGIATGPLAYIAQNYPTAITKVGALYGNAGSSVTYWHAFSAAMSAQGYKVLYSRATGPTETSFTSDILRMKNDGVQLLFLNDDDPPTIMRVIDAAAQQDWHPQVTFSSLIYDHNLIKLAAGTAANGVLIPLQSALYLGEDASTSPEVQLFLSQMHQVHPTFTPDEWAWDGWINAELFVQALKAAGPDPTQVGLVSALKNIHSFSANGALAPADVGNKKAATCWMLATVTNGTFSRVTPATGFNCTGNFYYYTGS
jgi:ABC-type branched-subunit amino acid transport system substrate-binding protein